MTIIYTLKTLVNKQQKLNLISRMWFQLMRLVMVLFNAHFFSLALVSFLSFCLVSTIRFVFCRLIIRRGLYGEWTSKWQPQHKRINSHEQYAFQVCFDWMARELQIFLSLCVWIRSIHPTSRSSRVCACIRFNITRGEKHRGDTAKNQYLVLELKETKKKISARKYDRLIDSGRHNHVNHSLNLVYYLKVAWEMCQTIWCGQSTVS